MLKSLHSTAGVLKTFFSFHLIRSGCCHDNTGMMRLREKDVYLNLSVQTGPRLTH